MDDDDEFIAEVVADMRRRLADRSELADQYTDDELRGRAAPHAHRARSRVRGRRGLKAAPGPA